NRLVRFILVLPERHCCEDGILPHTPWPVINSASNEFAGGHLRLVIPQSFPVGYEIPVVAWVVNGQEHAVRANGLLAAGGHPSIQVKRGVGSGFLAATNSAGLLTYRPQIGVLATNKTINLESSPVWTSVSGTLSGNVNWPAGSRMIVTNNLTIPSGASLTIGAATIIRLNAGVNLYLNGQLTIAGTVDQPVVFMPNTRAQPWGGFFLQAATSQITATGAVFVASGANPTGGAGHRQEQCLFYCDTHATVILTDCAAIAMAGQLGHTTDKAGVANYFFTLTRFLTQGATTAGEYYDSVFTVNDSAFIDFYVSLPFQEFHDGDEDGLYFKNIPTGYRSGFTNTLIGWTKDDGVDSGGDGAGILNFKSCWFESVYHEGNSLSGNGKDVYHFDDVFLGVGQAFEAGYGAPTGMVSHCLILGGVIGARFGDNYHPSQNSYGLMRATNSILINNHRDTWGLNWLDWLYRADRMEIRSNFLTAPNINHPNNRVWNPASDGWRLASFMTTPPDAPVGLGFATYTNQFTLGSLLDGAPVGLSCFTTNFVSVDYAFEDGNGVLSSGTLTFAPGETVKRIYPTGFNLADKSLVRVSLKNPTRGELTGTTNVFFQGNVTAPQLSLSVEGSQMNLARLGEGIAVSLSGPSSLTVSVAYRWEVSGRVLASGTLSFAPGQTLQWLAAPGVNPQDYDLLRLALSNPSGALVAGPTNYYLVKTIITPEPVTTTLVQKGPAGAWWKYDDTVTAAVPGWSTTNFPDSSWPKGQSSLGYNNTPSQTTTVGYGPSSGSKYITTYFRNYFNVTNAAALASLTFNLLRDDGAAVYLNGAELYRENLPQPPTTLAYTTTATTNVNNTASVWTSRTFALSALPAPLHDGTNVLAVEIHQNNAGSSDILFDLEVIGNPTPSSSSPPQPLYWGQFGSQLALAWTDASLQMRQATNVTGPWTNAPAWPASPALVTPTNPQSYFRLWKP
ncbi:MAG: hypothetical protein NTW03_21970, partial [Verrucomicrobia bacterium]|nr:hypothetical protein [Verrucomicrobiota bacterium]